MNNKKQFGQFFTRNSDYILQNLNKYIKGKEVVDPFAGGGDLISWALKNKAKTVKGYDIDKSYVDNQVIFKGDSILNHRDYKFVLTNPPYLNINKADKKVKEKYFANFKFEDLYQISLYSLLSSEEGLVIVPLNFLSARNSEKIRNVFFSKFEIVEMNYFKNQVFSDTSNNVIALYYRKKKNPFKDCMRIKVNVYPDERIINIDLRKRNSWSICGDFLTMIKNQNNKLDIRRLLERDISNNKGSVIIPAAYNHIKNIGDITVSEELSNIIKRNIILLKAIDTGSDGGKISLEDVRKYKVKCLVSKDSSRHMIYLIFGNTISIKDQENIIDIFNEKINKLRDEHLSLFLTNYRDNDRKRIGFDFVYRFINYIYYKEIANTANDRLLKLNQNTNYGEYRTI